MAQLILVLDISADEKRGQINFYQMPKVFYFVCSRQKSPQGDCVLLYIKYN